MQRRQEVFGDGTRGGDWAAARLVVEGERIVSADAPGLERDPTGLKLLDAARLGGEPLAVEALAAALGQVFRAQPEPGRVLVAMSGGVDSAVALLRAGPKAVGATLRLWQDPAGPDSERACCSPAAVEAARRTCHALGRPHVTLDLREEFREAVVAPFARAYEAGETPNPCTRCNGAFRFDALVELAERAGAEAVATGHYARIVERDGRLLVARGVDAAKDQSYMLATVEPDLLRHVRFPLGDQTKEQTRAEADRAGLAAARRPESQEACFLGGDDYRSFLERQGFRPENGDIVDEGGSVLGAHTGYWRFTPGQRRGLALAAARPLYVLRTEPRSNRVVVGPRESLAVQGLEARGRLYVPVECCEVQVRHRADPVPAAIEATDGGFRASLDEPALGVARGQVAVLYHGDAVVGAGVITETAG